MRQPIVQKLLKRSGMVVSVVILMLIAATYANLEPVPQDLQNHLSSSSTDALRLVDRSGDLIVSHRGDGWNRFDRLPLHSIPPELQAAFIAAEDQRFRRHSGIDWTARLHALWQNLQAGRAVRGASTLTEQVVRILNPRPRTVWSRWLEGWEAMQLEWNTSKDDILEFYLNQVPYASNRRGVLQAARFYFNRDPDTLTLQEQLALAVLVRAPSRLGPEQNPDALKNRVYTLAERMHRRGLISSQQLKQVKDQSLPVERPQRDIRAFHFARYALRISRKLPVPESGQVDTTLDGSLQNTVQSLLNQRLNGLRHQQVHHGAVLVADHTTGEILSWVVGGDRKHPAAGDWIDAVTVPRQPGSSLKPFLYALALETGWTAATAIDDTPLTEMVGRGLHRYRNYSRIHYGPVSLREALGNSLNIPAVKTVQYVGADRYLEHLQRLGFKTLDRHPDFYGDGLALGSAEVTLLDLVQAYSALANRGIWRSLRVLRESPAAEASRRVFSAETASLIGNILSDPKAREREFGAASILNLQQQTAVKTGTSSDYRDAWAVGYNDRYVVGVWMGNLDARSTLGITGATGPALVLRAVFNELNRHRQTQPLYLSPRLVPRSICRPHEEPCRQQTEYFAEDPGALIETAAPAFNPIRLRQPTPGLKLARDPRIPDEQEAFQFIVDGKFGRDSIAWIVDGSIAAVTREPRFLWPLQEGTHRVRVEVRDGSTLLFRSDEVAFTVQ